MVHAVAELYARQRFPCATLALIGVSPGDATLATLAYRLFTYWLPLPLGALGLALHRRWLARQGTAPGV